MSRLLDKLRRPTADNTANSFTSQVIGNKADAAAAGAVTSTDTLTAYIKQIVTHILAEADVETKIDVIDGYHDVAVADAVTNAVMSDIVGNKTDAAAEGAVSEVETLMAYLKQAITLAIARDTALGVVDGLHDVPTKDAATDLYIRDVVGIKTDSAAAGAVSEVESIMAYVKQVVTEGIARDAVIGAVDTATAAGAVTDADLMMAYIKQIVTAIIAIETDTDVIGALGVGLTDLGGMSTGMKAEVEAECVDAVVALPKSIEKSDGAVLNGADDLFVITGGPIRAKITGIVTTVLVGVSNGKLQITTTEPAATVDLNAGAVAIDADAAGASYRNIGATSVFTPVDAGMVIIDPVTVEDCEFLLPIGTVKFHSTAAQTGVIKWYMTYVPLSPNSVVAAA